VLEFLVPERNEFVYTEISMFVYKERNEFMHTEGKVRSHPHI